MYYDFGTSKDIEIDIELIANYPNQLCYDGKSYSDILLFNRTLTEYEISWVKNNLMCSKP